MERLIDHSSDCSIARSITGSFPPNFHAQRIQFSFEISEISISFQSWCARLFVGTLHEPSKRSATVKLLRLDRRRVAYCSLLCSGVSLAYRVCLLLLLLFWGSLPCSLPPPPKLPRALLRPRSAIRQTVIRQWDKTHSCCGNRLRRHRRTVFFVWWE